MVRLIDGILFVILIVISIIIIGLNITAYIDNKINNIQPPNINPTPITLKIDKCGDNVHIVKLSNDLLTIFEQEKQIEKLANNKNNKCNNLHNNSHNNSQNNDYSSNYKLNEGFSDNSGKCSNKEYLLPNVTKNIIPPEKYITYPISTIRGYSTNKNGRVYSGAFETPRLLSQSTKGVYGRIDGVNNLPIGHNYNF